MTKLKGMTKKSTLRLIVLTLTLMIMILIVSEIANEMTNARPSVIRASSFLRHSDFVIRHCDHDHKQLEE